MNRFFYWAIYGGTFLLSAVLLAASVMAVFGVVPFRSTPPLLASPAGMNDSAGPSDAASPSGATPRVAVSRQDSGGWAAVWQARSGPAAAVVENRAMRDDRSHGGGSMQVVRSEATIQAAPEQATPVAALQHPERPVPDSPRPPEVDRQGVDPGTPHRDATGGAAPLIVAGLWPVTAPDPPTDSPGEDPVNEPDVDNPGAGDQGDAGGGDAGGADGDPPGQEPSAGPIRLSLVPGYGEVAAGELVSVHVVLSEADRISSVPFHVRFNSEVLEYVGAKNGPAITSSPVQPILLAAVNPARPDDLAVGLALVRSSGRFSGSGTVVVLDFRALQAGQSDLLLENASVRDANSRPLAVQIENAALSVR